MSSVIPTPIQEIEYPSSDGKPLAENTKQLDWILRLTGNLRYLYNNRSDVFVGSDLLWYPVEGENTIRMAPDVFVVLGRPKGHRMSYKQWEENDIPMTIVFEILSPGNRDVEMSEKLLFYEDYGVREYYIYDPDRNTLDVRIRGESAFARQWFAKTFVSPLMKISFDLSSDEMMVYYPDGKPFLQLEEIREQFQKAERLLEIEEKKRLDAERQREIEEKKRLDAERQREIEEKKRLDAERQRELEKNQREEAEKQRDLEVNKRLEAERQLGEATESLTQHQRDFGRLKELALKVALGKATAEELGELAQLSKKGVSENGG